MSTLEQNKDVVKADEVFELLSLEKKRQIESIELIASENYTSKDVMTAIGSCLTNKYSEGLPGKRYYGGNEVIDKIENLCIKRALETYKLDPNIWGVNVQPYSGSPANLATYVGLLQPHDRIMGLDLPSGGHLTHGYQTATRKVSATSIFFESMPYTLNKETFLVDYDQLEANAKLFKPKLIIAGGSAYPREWDYERMRGIADSVRAYFMCDMAHISGIVATGKCLNPFDYCDVVTTTTHKTLRGPRAGMIFYKKELPCGKSTINAKTQIDNAVFPSLQGGPHNNTIAGIAIALKEAQTPEFHTYIDSVLSNAKILAETLQQRGYTIATGGTDNHLLLWNLKPIGLSANKMEKLYEFVNISVNKNTIFGDTSARNPSGLRLGSPAMTSRGLGKDDFIRIVDFLERGVIIAFKLQKKHGKMLKKFLPGMYKDEDGDLKILRQDIIEFCKGFSMPGI